MSLLFDLVKNVQGKPTDKVSLEVYDVRKSICNSCPKRMITGNCSVCGCFTNDKTKYSDEECPLGNW